MDTNVCIAPAAGPYGRVVVGWPMTTRPSPIISISVWGAQTAIAADSWRSVRRRETKAAEPRIAGAHSAIAR